MIATMRRLQRRALHGAGDFCTPQKPSEVVETLEVFIAETVCKSFFFHQFNSLPSKELWSIFRPFGTNCPAALGE